ncbi:hypothetical protein MTO96_010298 [Rhipicephalus appendiculatus]
MVAPRLRGLTTETLIRAAAAGVNPGGRKGPRGHFYARILAIDERRITAADRASRRSDSWRHAPCSSRCREGHARGVSIVTLPAAVMSRLRSGHDPLWDGGECKSRIRVYTESQQRFLIGGAVKLALGRREDAETSRQCSCAYIHPELGAIKAESLKLNFRGNISIFLRAFRNIAMTQALQMAIYCVEYTYTCTI